MNIPNLDALTSDELREFSDHAGQLAMYAHLKATALDQRAKGDIAAVVRAEGICEQIYLLLPAKWRFRP